MTSEVAPVLLENCSRATFPIEVVPGLRDLGIAGLPYRGYGCALRRFLLDGMIAMELARTDCSIATFNIVTFNGVHAGLAMGSIYLCGNDEQRERFLPAMASYDKIGSFGLTEPDVGSGASAGLQTTARRDGDCWILDGQKKWIGNSIFGDLTVIWTKDVDDEQVKGFVVENSSPGFTVEKQMHKTALRTVQNGLITLENLRVDESDRLQQVNSFKDTAAVLRMTRAGMGVDGGRLRYGRLRKRVGVCVRQAAIRSANRRLPTSARSAGADARQRDVRVWPMRAAVAAPRRGTGRGPAFLVSEGLLHHLHA